MVVPSFLSGSGWYKQCTCIVGPKQVCVVISLNQAGCIKYILCLRSVVIDTEIFFACLFHEKITNKCTCLFVTRHVNGLRRCHMVSVTFPCAVDC